MENVHEKFSIQLVLYNSILFFPFSLQKNNKKNFFDYPHYKGNSLKIPFSINGNE